MQEKELAVPGGSLYYETGRDSVLITRFQGSGTVVRVPEHIEGLPVTGIGKKAFLSRKDLRTLELPDTVEEIGDWAFACCDRLEQVTLHGRGPRFGKAVFLDCHSLVRITDGSGFCPAQLLAAAVREFEAYYLLDMAEAGSREWLKKWDAKLLSVLHAPDQDGYSRQVLCGEEDYGSTDLEVYLSNSRKRKVRLSLLRCLFSQGLSREFREELEAYLRAHTKGERGEEAWQVILEEYGDRKEYYTLFAKLGCVDRDNLSGILSDIGERYPEMKACFLRDCGEKASGDDFFASLEL